MGKPEADPDASVDAAAAELIEYLSERANSEVGPYLQGGGNPRLSLGGVAIEDAGLRGKDGRAPTNQDAARRYRI